LPLEDELYEQRVARIADIEALGFSAYGHRFDFTHTIPRILAEHSAKTAEELDGNRIAVRVAGSWIVATGLLLLGWAARRG